MGAVRAVRDAAWEFLRRLRRHDVFLLAAAIAYTAMLSFFPLLVGLIAILTRWVEHAAAQQAIVRALTPYLPPGVVSLVWGALDAATRARGTASIVATVALFWAATAAASALRHSLNRVLEAPRSRPFWRRKLVELVMVILGGTLISLSLIISAAAEILEAVPALEGAAAALRRIRLLLWATAIGPWILSGAAFVVIYRFLPNVRLRWRSVLIGAATAMVMFETTKLAFFWYLRALADYPLVYSHLAGIVIFMIWLYLGALVTLVGAEIAGHIDRQAALPGPQPQREGNPRHQRERQQ